MAAPALVTGSMHPLVRRVSRAMRQQQLVADGDRVAVAVSGGSDSVALLCLLEEMPRVRWRLSGVIHVNHRLRPEAEADERFVAALARRMSLPVDSTSVDVGALVRRERRSVEVVAREARYRCFEAAAARLGATLVMTGHTMDDQAETVMLRLLRGSGARGVSAIRPRRGIYARPLLACRRSELRAYLALRGESYRDDSTNAVLTVARNRIRHLLMPVIDQLSPGGAGALARFAALSAEDERELSGQAARLIAKAVRSTGDGVQLERVWLSGLPPAIARRVIREGLERSGGTPTFRDIAAVLEMARGVRATSAVHLHRVRATRDGDQIVMAPSAGPARPARTPVGFHLHLSIPGRVDLPETGGAILASFLNGSQETTSTERGSRRVALQAHSVEPPFVVRSRQPGDRMRPLGAPGSRSLQDLFVDRKVPRGERDAVPVVVDAAGRIVWVVGVAMADACRVTAPEAGMVILELEKSHQ